MAQHQDARRRSQEERRNHPEAEGTCRVAACPTHGRSHTRLPPPMEEVRVGTHHAAYPGNAEPEDRDAGGARERERRSPNPEKRDGEANHQEPRPDRAEYCDVPRWMLTEGMGREEQRHRYPAGHAHDPSREQEPRGAPSSELDVALDGIEDSGPDAFSHLGGCVLAHHHRPQRSRVRSGGGPGDMPVSRILHMGFSFARFPKAAGQRRTPRRRRAFPITETELRLIAAAASIGLRRMPRKG